MANRREDREKYWRGIVEDWSESDLSKRRYCEARKISYSSFCYWRRRLAEVADSRGSSTKGDESSTHPFIPVEIKPSVRVESTWFYEVTLEGGHLIRVPFHFEPDSLGRLIEVLEGRPC